MDTRKNIYLIGFAESDILVRKLPTNKQILSIFFYNLKSLKKTIFESAYCVVKRCTKIWEQTGIPVTSEVNSIKKIKRLHNEWKKIYKRRNESNRINQKIREITFKKKLDLIFYISQQRVKHLDLENVQIEPSLYASIHQDDLTKTSNGVPGNADCYKNEGKIS